MPPGFRRLEGYRVLPALVAALCAHDAQPDRSNGKLGAAQDAAGLTSCLRLNSERQRDIASFHAKSATDSSTESLCSASLRSCGLFFTISRRRIRFERTKKTSRDPCYFIDCGYKRGFVCLRRLVEAADFSHELQRRGTNLFGSDRRIEIEKDFDIPAHSLSPQDPENSQGRAKKTLV